MSAVSCFSQEFAGLRALTEMPFVHGLHADIRLGSERPLP
jgi:hypothetical protein